MTVTAPPLEYQEIVHVHLFGIVFISCKENTV